MLLHNKPCSAGVAGSLSVSGRGHSIRVRSTTPVYSIGGFVWYTHLYLFLSFRSKTGSRSTWIYENVFNTRDSNMSIHFNCNYIPILIFGEGKAPNYGTRIIVVNCVIKIQVNLITYLVILTTTKKKVYFWLVKSKFFFTQKWRILKKSF